MLDQPLSRVDALQCLVLGWLLGDATLRDRVPASWFTDGEFQCAVQRLKEQRGSVSLENILKERMNVDWSTKDGPPLERVLAALKRDGEFSIVMHAVNSIVRDTCDTDGLPRNEPCKDEFVGRLFNLKETLERAQWERDNPVDALKQKGREKL